MGREGGPKTFLSLAERAALSDPGLPRAPLPSTYLNSPVLQEWGLGFFLYGWALSEGREA